MGLVSGKSAPAFAACSPSQSVAHNLSFMIKFKPTVACGEMRVQSNCIALLIDAPACMQAGGRSALGVAGIP
jgi:hypothetical protein